MIFHPSSERVISREKAEFEREASIFGVPGARHVRDLATLYRMRARDGVITFFVFEIKCTQGPGLAAESSSVKAD